MTEPLRDAKADAVAPRCRNRQSSGGEDDAIAVDGPIGGDDRESIRGSQQIGDLGIKPDLDGVRSREGDEPIANVACPVRSRKQLAGFLLQRQRNLQVALEELALLVQRPGAQHPAQQVSGGAGDEAFGREDGG